MRPIFYMLPSSEEGGNFVFLDTQTEFMQIIAFIIPILMHLKRDCKLLQKIYSQLLRGNNDVIFDVKQRNASSKGKILSLMRFKRKKKEKNNNYSSVG